MSQAICRDTTPSISDAIAHDKHPIDTITHRIEQSRGILAAIAGAYDDKTREHNVSGSALNGALWAVEEMLNDIDVALDKMIAGAK